jgi:hypothetical protein
VSKIIQKLKQQEIKVEVNSCKYLLSGFGSFALRRLKDLSTPTVILSAFDKLPQFAKLDCTQLVPTHIVDIEVDLMACLKAIPNTPVFRPKLRSSSLEVLN